MKIVFVLITVLLLFAGIAAAECTDTDGGKNYAEKGDTKIISGKEDICIISPSAEVRQDTSPYLKEYYCKDDQIKSEIVECIREGFEKCEYGKCVGGEAEAEAKDTNYTAPPPEPECGNSIVDPGEECDPMNKMCFDDDGNIGLCNEYCQCEIKIKKDGSKAKSNDEEDTDTTNIEIDTPTETDAEPVVVKDAKPEETEEDKEITVTIAEKPREEAKPRGFFSKIWAWMAGLFS